MDFAPSFYDHLSDRLELALYDTKEELRTQRLTALLDELMKFRITEPVFFGHKQRQVGEEMDFPVGPLRQEVVPGGLKNIPQFVELSPEAALGIKMSALSERLKAKAIQARGIVPKAAAEFEAEMDALIAEGPKLKTELGAAVAPHKDVAAGIRGEFDGLRDALNIFSNGGPSLDPLHASETSAAPSEGKPA